MSKQEFESIANQFKALSAAEKRGDCDLADIGKLGAACIKLINAPHIEQLDQGATTLEGRRKSYELRKSERNISRPIRKDLFCANAKTFLAEWKRLSDQAMKGSGKVSHEKLDETLYTAVTSFAVAYDLYKPTSRKTPGTFFEIIVGELLGAVTRLPRGKQIDLPDTDYKVPTDIVLMGAPGKPSLVIPTKITTRERIVQPWAHQRILADVYGKQYRSILVCVSELQRDGDKGINEICVPGQVKGFQKHLAQMSGMYYLDVPASYVTDDMKKVIAVKPLSFLFNGDLIELLELDNR